MKPRNRQKHRGRKESGTFTSFPHSIQDSPNWSLASGTSVKLLLDIARQYNGFNNGNLCASMGVMKSRGWTSPEVLTWARRELLHFGFIAETKLGGFGLGPSLYAITWRPIDDCKGKHHCPATKTASGAWKVPKPPFVRGKNHEPHTSSVLAPIRDP